MNDLNVAPDVVLTSLIEVGIALVGFTGLIVSLTSRREAIFENLLSILVIAPSMIVVLSLIPLLLGIGGVGEPFIWQISSALFAIYFLYTVVHRSRLMRNLETTEGEVQRRTLFLVLVVCSAIFALLQVANVVVIQAAWPFLAYLIFYVLFCLVIFGSLVLGIWRSGA